MVQSNGFSLGIISAHDHEKLKRGEYNYVALDNGTEYKIELGNHRSTEAMVEVYMEGTLIGTWFVPSNNSIVIERPVDVARKFTFFSEKDPRASAAGVVAGAGNNGLIKAIFYPRISTPIIYSTSRSIASYHKDSYASGATVLGSTSSQQFRRKERLTSDQIDWPNQTTLIVRLVVRDTPYISIGNAIPPRID